MATINVEFGEFQTSDRTLRYTQLNSPKRIRVTKLPDSISCEVVDGRITIPHSVKQDTEFSGDLSIRTEFAGWVYGQGITQATRDNAGFDEECRAIFHGGTLDVSDKNDGDTIMLRPLIILERTMGPQIKYNVGAGTPCTWEDGSASKTIVINGQDKYTTDVLPVHENGYEFLGWRVNITRLVDIDGNNIASTFRDIVSEGQIANSSTVIPIINGMEIGTITSSFSDSKIEPVWADIYTAPTMSDITGYRVASAGSDIELEDGPYSYIHMTYTDPYWRGTFNGLPVIIQDDFTSSDISCTVSIVGGVPSTVPAGDITVNTVDKEITISYSSQVDVNESWTFSISVGPAGQEMKTFVTIEQYFITIDFLKGGHGIAIGHGATEEDLFDVYMDTRFNEDVSILGLLNGMVMPFPFFKATASANRSIATAGTQYYAPIDTVVFTNDTNGDYFSFTSGTPRGVHCKKKGVVLVIGSVYIQTTTGNLGCYIRQGDKNCTNINDATEMTTSGYFTASGGCIRKTSTILEVNADDKIFLCGRSSTANNTILTNNDTSIVLVYLSLD